MSTPKVSSLQAEGGAGSTIRPSRSRTRAVTEPAEKSKSPVVSERKKTPPARKTPARGRYVDEYARPAC